MNATTTSHRRYGQNGLKPILQAACCLILLRSGALLSADADTATNLAFSARDSAFEFQPGLPAAWANDGNMDTRWSGIPGHNVGGWEEAMGSRLNS